MDTISNLLNATWYEMRAAAAARIRATKPWTKATGPRTQEGKAISSQNSYRGGRREKSRALVRSFLASWTAFRRLDLEYKKLVWFAERLEAGFFPTEEEIEKVPKSKLPDVSVLRGRALIKDLDWPGDAGDADWMVGLMTMPQPVLVGAVLPSPYYPNVLPSTAAPDVEVNVMPLPP